MARSRLLRTILRTLHLLAFGAYYGGHVFGVAPERLFPALLAVIGTGGAFFLFEVWQAPVFLTQLRGVATYVKLALLISVYWLWDDRIIILTLIATIGAVISHLPSNLRNYAVLQGRVVETHSKG